MFKLFYSQKKIDQKIESLEKIVSSILVPLADPTREIEKNYEEKWKSARTSLNMLVLELCLGGDYNSAKKTFKFHGHLPNYSQTAKITEQLRRVDIMERPVYFDTDGNELADTDMPIEVLSDMKTSEIRKNILNPKGIRDIGITSRDIAYLLSIGEKIRKGEIRNTALIIGGVTLVLTGAAIASVIIANRVKDAKSNHESDGNDGDISDDDIIDADSMESDEDSGEDIMENDDAPDVIIEDDIPEV